MKFPGSFSFACGCAGGHLNRSSSANSEQNVLMAVGRNMAAQGARRFLLVVGHWPAGNIEIQPILSMTCALLGGNAV